MVTIEISRDDTFTLLGYLMATGHAFKEDQDMINWISNIISKLQYSIGIDDVETIKRNYSAPNYHHSRKEQQSIIKRNSRGRPSSSSPLIR